ncbi:MAG: ABC-2 transporter permease [Coprococcus sp.]
MAGLIEKDIRIIFQRKQTLILFVALAAMFAFTQEGSFVLGYLPLLISILAISTISYDELDNGFTFILTLPINVKTYVTEKYVFCGIAGIVSWITSIIIYYTSEIVHGRSIDLLKDVPMILVYLAVVALMMAFSIPVQIRYGANGSRIVILVTFGVVAILAVILKKVVSVEMVAAIRQTLENISDKCLFILAGLTVIILLAVSYLCSLRAMRKKAF